MEPSTDIEASIGGGLSRALTVLLAAISVAVTALGSYALAVRGVVFVWAPSGVVLALLIMSPRDRWFAIAVGSFVANVMVDLQIVGRLLPAILGPVANVTESIVAAIVLRRLVGGRNILGSLQGIGALLVGAAIVANAFTALLGGAVLRMSYPGREFWIHWFRWWIGDGLGMIVVAPAVLALGAGIERARNADFVLGRVVEGCLLLAVAICTSAFVFGGSTGAGHLMAGLYLTFPILIWAALRVGAGLPAFALSIVVGLLLCFAGDGRGPFVDATRSVDEEAINVYSFVVLMVVSVLVPSAAIAERKVGWERVRESEARYRASVDTAQDGVLTLDSRGRIRFANPAMHRMLGVTPPALLGGEIAALSPPGHRAEAAELLQAAAEPGVETSGQVRLLHMLHVSGREVPVEQAAAAWEIDGERYVTLVARDVSDRIRLESELRQAQKLEALGKVSGLVAHEFRNELTVIRANLELGLCADDMPAPMRESLQEIDLAVARGERITRDLLAFGRRESTEANTINLDALLERSVKTARPLIEKSIHLDFSATGGPRWVRADAAALQQAMMNLLLNARDAMPTGGRLEVRLSTDQVDEEMRRRLALNRGGLHAVIDIVDSGVGMDASTVDRIFEPFFTTKSSGTGLGLAVVYGTIRRSGGAVRAESTLGTGTSFQILLPVEDSSVADA